MEHLGVVSAAAHLHATAERIVLDPAHYDGPSTATVTASVPLGRMGTRLAEIAELPPARLRRRKYLSVALLVIDQMGFGPMDRTEASLFFRLVSYRYGRGSILITTNKGIKDWPELLAGDEVLVTAILDRPLHHSHVLNIKGRSCRLQDLQQAASLQQ